MIILLKIFLSGYDNNKENLILIMQVSREKGQIIREVMIFTRELDSSTGFTCTVLGAIIL